MSLAVDRDLWPVADAAGLSPKGRGRNFAFDCPDCGRKGKASGRRDGPWHCFACDAAGNALTLARRFELAGAELPRPTVQAPEATNRNGVAPSAARAAWAALAGQRDAYHGHMSRYLAEVRGWPAELADAGAHVSGWAWIPEDCPELPRPLAWTTRDADRRAAFALADATGEIWTLERRWTSPAPPADPGSTPKALRLRTRSEDAGRLAIFGRVPDAVAAAGRGEPVYLCEGGPDYLAAAALCRLEGRGAALGAHGHAALPKVAAALRAALEAAGAPVAGVHVLCVPHLGDKGDVGERSMLAAADALAGVGAVSVVRVPVDADGHGDLADAARGGGSHLQALVAAAARRVDTLAVVDVRTGEAVVTRSLISDALDGMCEGDVALLMVPPGAGKSEAALHHAVAVAAMGRRVVYLAPNHGIAAELADRARTVADRLQVAVEHARGMSASCPLPGEAATTEIADAIRRAQAIMGRRMCEGCPLADACPGTRAPVARRGTLVVGAHAAAASLGAQLDLVDPDASTYDAADLIIVDELPAPVATLILDSAALATLTGGDRMRAGRWYRAHPATQTFAAAVAAAAAAVATDAPVDRYAARVSLSGLVARLRDSKGVVQAAAAVAAEPDDAPMPRSADARRGVIGAWPDPDALALVRAVAAAVAADAPVDRLDTLASYLLRVDPDATPGDGWAFERRTVWSLPLNGRILALDATGADSLGEWQSVARIRGGAVRVTEIGATGAAPISAEHYRTDRLRTSRLWARTGRRVRFRADAPGAIRNALLRAAGAVPCALGILTHRPLADALRWGANLVIDPDADPPEGCAFAADDVHALEIAELAADLIHRGWALTVGHYGRDTRGTNAFGGVDALAVLGSPRGDYGATVADAAAIGIDAATLAADRTRAETIQAIARARHLRRGPADRVRLFLASDADPPTGPELPGVAWTTTRADRGHAPTLARIDAAREIAAWADRAGCLDVRDMLAALVPHAIDVSERVARRLARAEAERRGWLETRIGEAHRLVFEPPTANDAERSACRLIGSNSMEREPPRGAPPPKPPEATVVSPYHEATRGQRTPHHAVPAPFDPPDEWPELPPVAEYDGPPLDDYCDPPPLYATG